MLRLYKPLFKYSSFANGDASVEFTNDGYNYSLLDPLRGKSSILVVAPGASGKATKMHVAPTRRFKSTTPCASCTILNCGKLTKQVFGSSGRPGPRANGDQTDVEGMLCMQEAVCATSLASYPSELPQGESGIVLDAGGPRWTTLS